MKQTNPLTQEEYGSPFIYDAENNIKKLVNLEAEIIPTVEEKDALYIGTYAFKDYTGKTCFGRLAGDPGLTFIKPKESWLGKVIKNLRNLIP